MREFRTPVSPSLGRKAPSAVSARATSHSGLSTFCVPSRPFVSNAIRPTGGHGGTHGGSHGGIHGGIHGGTHGRHLEGYTEGYRRIHEGTHGGTNDGTHGRLTEEHMEGYSKGSNEGHGETDGGTNGRTHKGTYGGTHRWTKQSVQQPMSFRCRHCTSPLLCTSPLWHTLHISLCRRSYEISHSRSIHSYVLCSTLYLIRNYFCILRREARWQVGLPRFYTK